MPGTWRVRVIQARLEAEGIEAVVEEKDLLELTDEDRHAALDAMVKLGAQPPLVLVGGELSSSGGIDIEVVVEAAKRIAALG